MTTAREHHGGMATGLEGFGPAEEFTVEDLERMSDGGLVDGRYFEVGCAVGGHSWAAQRPFPVTVTPAGLVAGLRRA